MQAWVHMECTSVEHWRRRLHSHFSLSTVIILTIINMLGFNRKAKEVCPIYTYTNTHTCT